MMKGQIEEQKGDVKGAREAYTEVKSCNKLQFLRNVNAIFAGTQ